MTSLDELERRKRELELRRDIARLERNERFAGEAAKVTTVSLRTIRKVAIGLVAMVCVAALIAGKVAWGSYDLWSVQRFALKTSLPVSISSWDHGWRRRLRLSDHSKCIETLSSVQSTWARGNFELTTAERLMLESGNYTMEAPRRLYVMCIPSGTPRWVVELLGENPAA